MELTERIFIVRVSPDELKAYLSIDKDAENLKFNETKLKYILKGKGVVAGIKEDVLKKIVEDYENEKIISKVLVAEGVQAKPGVPAKIDLKFEISSKPKEDETGKVNYRDIQTVINVKKDQLLAIKKKMIPPVNGVTVTGKVTTIPEVQDIPLIAGQNVAVDEQETTIFYRAELDGALTYENNRISVFPELKIDKDVDFNTGNLYFKGNIKIGRDVLPDFVVEAEGKITIWGSAVACTLKADDDIEVRAGIIGKNKGEAISKKNITANFVENAKLIAGEDIIIKNGIIGSDIYAAKYVSVATSKSKIVESIIKAGKGVSAYNIGSRFSSNTKIITGIDPDKEKEYLNVKKVLESKIEEARNIEKKYGRSLLENKNITRTLSKQAMIDLEKWDILKLEIKEINENLKKVEDLMYDYDATVVVKETLFPKVYIKIGKYEITTSSEYFKATVHYSEEEDRLIIV